MEKGNISKISMGKITETSKGDYIVRAKNVTTNAGQKVNMQSGDGIVYGEPGKRNGIKDDIVDVVIGVFFDGTRNNRTNNQLRENYEKHSNGKKPAIAGEDSYENAPSNVQKLETTYVKNAYHRTIYIEGVATTNDAEDQSIAAGLGYFSTGVLDKVKVGCKLLADELKNVSKGGQKINSVTIDLFGFSRGSTCARNFAHEITKEEHKVSRFNDKKYPGGYYFGADGSKTENKNPISKDQATTMQPSRGMFGQYLLAHGIKINALHLRFAGLFDSVSSYGVMHRNDVWELDLNEINKTQFIVHLTAADERRDNFELTAVTKGITKSLPGVHSDIGGGYRDLITDQYLSKPKQVERVTTALNNKIYHERKRLLDQAWYTESQLKIEENLNGSKLIGTRKISNKYSLIPLHLMAEFFQLQTKVKLNTKRLVTFYTILEDDPKLNLMAVYKRLYNYAFSNAQEMTYFSDSEIKLLRNKVKEGFLSNEKFAMLTNDHNMLKELRNRYLHNSADYGEFGMSPTWDNERVIYNKKSND